MQIQAKNISERKHQKKTEREIEFETRPGRVRPESYSLVISSRSQSKRSAKLGHYIIFSVNLQKSILVAVYFYTY